MKERLELDIQFLESGHAVALTKLEEEAKEIRQGYKAGALAIDHSVERRRYSFTIEPIQDLRGTAIPSQSDKQIQELTPRSYIEPPGLQPESPDLQPSDSDRRDLTLSPEGSEKRSIELTNIPPEEHQPQIQPPSLDF